jgi:Tfp pilus assembly ATPase PilU
VREGLITVEEAVRAASSPHDFKLMLEAGAARRGEPIEAINAVEA